MFASCGSSSMLLALLVLLSVANTEASDLDLLDGGVQTWLSPDRVTRCPVHSKVEPVVVDGGQGVSFVVEAQSGKRFSLVEKYLPAGGLQGYGGLQLNFTTSGLASWTLRLYDSNSYACKFVYIINKPDGSHSLTLPWSSFRAQTRRRKSSSSSGYSVQPSSISHLAVYMPNGAQQAQLTLQTMHAMRDLSAMELPATITANDEMAEGFDGPFVGMGISGHNDFPMVSVNNPAECAAACKEIAECRSFDYGARGQVTGECWLSLADRESAGYAYRSWELYNYYEIKGAATTMVTDTIMALSNEDMTAVMEFFDGPFVGMGITGHNDFGLVEVNSPGECAEACTQTAECSSFDHGARGSVTGECWLSRADRKSASSAYESWEMYNYYEFKSTDSTATTTTDSTATTTRPIDDYSMTGDTSMVAAEQIELAAAKPDTTPEPDFLGRQASHAERFSFKPMICVQAVGAIVIFMAS